MKYSSLLTAILILVSCNKNHKTTIILTYDDDCEALNGKVKRLIEITRQPYKVDTVVTDFDVNGKKAEVRSSGHRLDKWSYKYNRDGKLTEALKNNGKFPNVAGKYDQSGRLVELTYDTKELQDTSDHFLKQDRFFYKYNTQGYLTELNISFLDNKQRLSIKYKYSNQHLIIERDQFDGVGNLEFKGVYRYQVIDRKGNWLKRMIITNNDSAKADTITRKISYY